MNSFGSLDSVRSHDTLYLSENRYENPAETAKWLSITALSAFDELPLREPTKQIRVLDIGCAAGEFIYLLKQQRPNFQFVGVDILPELLVKAKQKVGVLAEFGECNIDSTELPSSLKGAFDLVFLKGVHSIFDDPFPALNNCIAAARGGALVCIAGLFNPHAYDVILRYRASSDSRTDKPWELGWNSISVKSVETFLDEHPRVLGYKWEIFDWPLKVSPGADLVRTWTERINKNVFFVNGLNTHFQFRALMITTVD